MRSPPPLQKEVNHPFPFPRGNHSSFQNSTFSKEANAEVLQLQKLTRTLQISLGSCRNPTHLNISNLSLTTSSPVNKTICSLDSFRVEDHISYQQHSLTLKKNKKSHDLISPTITLASVKCKAFSWNSCT